MRLLVTAVLVVLACGDATGPEAVPDEERILFTVRPIQTGEAFYRLYTMQPDGSDIQLFGLQPILPGNQYRPSISDDGGTITLMYLDEIYTMGRNGGGLRRVRGVGPTGAGASSVPEISPDGTRIASGDGDIFVMDVDGGNLANLTDGFGGEYHPTWSPDGNRIAFIRGVTGDVYVMNSDGTGLQQLTDTRSTFESEPDWSPNGDKILYLAKDGAGLRLHTIRPDGTDRRRLETGKTRFESPAWSPDGQSIVFNAFEGALGVSSIYRMPASGSTFPTNLTEELGDVYAIQPHWGVP